MTRLTIGMATYDDYDGVFFTIQSLRMFHKICNNNDIEYIVLDNNPTGNHSSHLKNFLSSIKNARYIPYDEKISSFSKYEIVKFAKGKYTLLLDCHILLALDSIDYLLKYFEQNTDCKDLVQGPLLYDDLGNYATEFLPVWRGHMYGTWHTNKESYELGNPFEIQLQGMGLCAFETKNWPNINKHFRGFGGEEGYISEKFRQNGGKNICLPQLKWLHRFGRPNGAKYRLVYEDRIFNYLLGWLEITNDINHIMIKNIYEHFSDVVPKSTIDNLLKEAKQLV